MNYCLSDLPDSGKTPIVYMNIDVNGERIGRLVIRLYRDIFPAGVENFVGIISGKTYRVVKHGTGKYAYLHQTKRTYKGCRFYNMSHRNYLVSGDIYNNNGSNAGSIYEDSKIPAEFGDVYHPHDKRGLISLVPFYDEATNELYYDSTFMITLDDAKPSNSLFELDQDQIVIGHVVDGISILERIDTMIVPFAGRKYPNITISECGVLGRVPTIRAPPIYMHRKNNRIMIPSKKPHQKIEDE